MKKYRANYVRTNPAFVIQNLVDQPLPASSPEYGLLQVLKNILQRGLPTRMSTYLGQQLELDPVKACQAAAQVLISPEPPRWVDTIKGDEANDYYPARTFFEEILPAQLGEDAFVQALILPEALITDICEDAPDRFINQQVDFYLPQAKLVIEIDGQQHKRDDLTRVQDRERDALMEKHGVAVVRITTGELRSGSYAPKIAQIRERLRLFEANLQAYRQAWQQARTGQSPAYRASHLLPTAIIRFQLLLIELLENQYLEFDQPWRFEVLDPEESGEFVELAVEDFLRWWEQLCRLRKVLFIRPEYEVEYQTAAENFQGRTDTINVDFSLQKRYTDEADLNPDVLYVRTDYYEDKEYFTVSSAPLISYSLTDEDKPALEFFLQNIFDFPGFREGQFQIVANALAGRDTMGLLPTGGGKSMCYQIATLLQPGPSFIVCPIKSLMADQYDNMKRKQINRVAYINSGQSPQEKEKAQREFSQGKYLFIWISPERFQIKGFREYLSTLNAHIRPAYAVIDEVHCLSEWGHSFRTSYLNLAQTIDRYCPDTPFLGLTATASVNVLKDIKVEFSRNREQLPDVDVISRLDFSRKELEFEVIPSANQKLKILKKLLKEYQDENGFMDLREEAGLVFTPNVNGDFGCFNLSNRLAEAFQEKVDWYSGEVPTKKDQNGNKTPVMDHEKFKKHKQEVQDKFKENQFPLMVATKAFGMGIDKDNIAYTVHYGIPSSVESLYQEAGRAGRWDINSIENKGRVAKCKVLFTQEETENEIVNELFGQTTSISRMKEISEQMGYGNDLSRQLFLFLNGEEDIASDFQLIKGIIDHYYAEGKRVVIYWEDAYQKLRINEDRLEKAIYRLSLLGIVSDWTTDFISHYEVQFKTKKDASVLASLTRFIRKYESNLNMEKEVRSINKSTLLEQSIEYLLSWIFRKITYNRKQTLKTLYDWCSDFVEESQDSETFKKRIDSYFIITDRTIVLQHVAEKPADFARWFQPFYEKVDDKTEEVFIGISEMGSFRDQLSRFLESYASNMGLNLISGLVRLFLEEYEDADGRSRFENSLQQIIDTFSAAQQAKILQALFQLAYYLPISSKEAMGRTLIQFYPEKLEEFAQVLDQPHLMNEVIRKQVSHLTQINKQLYEQLSRIS